MSQSGLPFDDIRALAAMLPPPDREAMAVVRERNATLAKPLGALGQLEALAEWLAGWQGNARPSISRPLLAIFAGTHGIAGDADDTAEDVATLAAGGAAANQICATSDVGLKVFELALQLPTRDVRIAAALEERDCAATIAFGMEAVAGGTDLICIGTVGQGGDVAAAAILTALFGGGAGDWLASAGDTRSQEIVVQALATHSNAISDPLEVLRRLGGRECAAAVGAILAARLQRIPVLLSGIESLAAAAVLHQLDAEAVSHCRAAHAAPAAAHAQALKKLGLSPILSTEFSQGDGAGAALAVAHLRAAAACLNDMAKGPQASAPPMLN